MPSLNSSKYQPAHPINNQLINNIQSDALRIFILVYEQLSFSAVARMDNVSPSSISRSILQLEQNLGVQLFYRNTRHLVASEYAGILIVYARQIQSQLNQALTALQQHSGEIKGWVRINAPVLFGQMHLAPHLAVLQQQFPALLIDLQLSDDFIDPYQDAADLIFRISPMPDSSLKSRVIDRCKYHLAASPAYLQKKGTPSNLEQFKAHQALVYQAKQGPNQWFIQQQQTWQQIHPQVIIRSNHADSLRSAALNGQGLVLFPDWLIGEDLKAGRLTELFAQQPCSISKQPLYIAAIYPQTQAMPLKVRTVLDFFLTQFGQLEGACYWKYPTA